MSFTAFDGYAVVADLRCGSDSLAPSAPELAVSSSPDDEASCRYCWDSNLSDGFDTGWVNVELDFDASGSVVWTVGGRSIKFSTGATGEFQAFVFRTGASAVDSTAAFRNVSAEFFSTGTTTPQIGTADDGAATTADSANSTDATGGDAEALAFVAPTGGGITSAKFFAQVRMESPDLPSPTDLFGQVFVYTSPKSS